MAKYLWVIIVATNEDPFRATGKVMIPLQRNGKGVLTSLPNLDSVTSTIRRIAESDSQIGAVIKMEKALPTDSP